MLNKEVKSEEMLNVLQEYVGVKAETEELVHCDSIDCKECLLNNPNGACYSLKEWLNQESGTKIYPNWKKDERILVSNDLKHWTKSHFLGWNKETNHPVVFSDGSSSWTCECKEKFASEYKFARKGHDNVIYGDTEETNDKGL